MDLSLLAGAAAASSWLSFVRLSGYQRLLLPVVLLYGSSLAFGLQGLSQLFVVAGSAMRGAGLALLVSELVKEVFSSERRSHSTRAGRAVVLSAAGLCSVLMAHLLLEGRGALPVSPWGPVFVFVAIVYWLRFGSEVARSVQGDLRFSRAMAGAALSLAAMVAAVRLGLLAGNTGKFELGEGGVGLANSSTNETAALALSPLLWTMRLLDSDDTSDVRLGYAAVLGSLAVILATGSRMSIAIAMVVVGAFVFRTGGRALRGRRLAIGIAFAVVAIAGAAVIRARTTAEVDAFATGDAVSAQFAVPGGERAILWVSYLAAFLESARESPSEYVWGVGPAGLADLYANSALPALGITLDRASFYPVHSDVIELLMTTGLIGGLLLIVLAYGVIRLPVRHGMGRYAFSAAFVLGAIATVDMVQYVPGVVAAVLAAFASALQLEQVVRVGDEVAEG